MKYKLTVTETTRYAYTVEADSEKQALEMYHRGPSDEDWNGEYIDSAGDVEVEVEEVKDE